jgi:hypothetical protein
MNGIRLVLGNGATKETTFLSATLSHAMDTNSNALKELPRTNAKFADYFAPDTSPPTVASFSLDMSLMKLMLTFSEPVHGPSLIASKLYIQSGTSASTNLVTIQLSSSVYEQDPLDTLTVDVVLSQVDANALKFDTKIAVSNTRSTFQPPNTLSTILEQFRRSQLQAMRRFQQIISMQIPLNQSSPHLRLICTLSNSR